MLLLSVCFLFFGCISSVVFCSLTHSLVSVDRMENKQRGPRNGIEIKKVDDDIRNGDMYTLNIYENCIAKITKTTRSNVNVKCSKNCEMNVKSKITSNAFDYGLIATTKWNTCERMLWNLEKHKYSHNSHTIQHIYSHTYRRVRYDMKNVFNLSSDISVSELKHFKIQHHMHTVRASHWGRLKTLKSKW